MLRNEKKLTIFQEVHRESYIGGPMRNPPIIPPLVPRPTLEMRAFDFSLRDGECNEDQDLLAVNGWLSQSGQLFACGWMQHDASVKGLGYPNERDASKAGYIRLSSMKWQIEKRFSTDVLITEKQSNTIKSWHEVNALDTAYYEFCLAQELKRMSKNNG